MFSSVGSGYGWTAGPVPRCTRRRSGMCSTARLNLVLSVCSWCTPVCSWCTPGMPNSRGAPSFCGPDQARVRRCAHAAVQPCHGPSVPANKSPPVQHKIVKVALAPNVCPRHRLARDAGLAEAVPLGARRWPRGGASASRWGCLGGCLVVGCNVMIQCSLPL